MRHSGNAVPRAGVDAIDTPHAAMSLIRTVLGTPPQVVLIPLDADGRGRDVFIVDNVTEFPTAINATADACTRMLAALADAGIHPRSLVVATSRRDTALRCLADDVNAWNLMDRRCRELGIELIEWIVVEPGATWCPRSLVEDGTRWRAAPDIGAA